MPDPLVVFSHLRWDFVTQRPQHVLSRIAQRRPVLVIEEPVHTPDAPPHWEHAAPAPGVETFRPHTTVAEPGFSDAQFPALSDLVDQLAAERDLEGTPVWLYTPMALPLADRLEPSVLVYDCMDELSAFDFAPPQLLEREAAVLDRADVVFTGGPSLYRAKKDRSANVHCFSSSVDAAHFGKARPGLEDGALEDPTDQAHLPYPRLGFFGVIDERIDLEVVAALAAADPDWQIVMVGPVVKIDPASLPQAPNLHWLGGKDYADLPSYLAGWDVCLLPFAQNAATEFISPTKTLEYMAAERLIVSAPITDVAEPYGDIVYLGDTADAFVSACASALKASDGRRAETVAQMREVLAQTSWDVTAGRMADLVDAALEDASRPAVAA